MMTRRAALTNGAAVAVSAAVGAIPAFALEMVDPFETAARRNGFAVFDCPPFMDYISLGIKDDMRTGFSISRSVGLKQFEHSIKCTKPYLQKYLLDYKGPTWTREDLEAVNRMIEKKNNRHG